MKHQIFKDNTSFYLLIVLALITQFTFAQDNNTYSLLWKIEGNNLETPSYLFGTMHIDDARAFNFSDAVMPAIKSAEYFALEVNPDSLIEAITRKEYDLTANKFYKNLLKPKDYNRLLKRFEEVNAYTLEDSEIMSPDSVMSLLIPDIEKEDDKSTFVDFYLLGQAKTMNKTIVGLEDIDDQLNYFDKLSDEEKTKEVLSLLDIDVDSINKTMELMTKIYATGDINKIADFVEKYDFIDQTMISRNNVMSNSIIEIMKKGSLFASVGAAHLVGKGSVIELLKNQGYNVSIVDAKFTGVAETYKIDTSKGYWYNYIDNDLGFQLELPKTPNIKQDYDKFTIHGYGDIPTNTSYLFMGFDVGYTLDQSQIDTFIETMITNIIEKRDGVVIHRDELTESDQFGYDVTAQLPDNIMIKARLVVKNNHFYYFSAETQKEQINENYINRFFNSITIDGIAPKLKTKGWREFKSEKGAFTIQIPVEATEVSREHPNPINPEGEPYFLNLYMATDNENFNNYLIRYNDQPVGYFLQNPEIAFKETEDGLTQKAKLLSEPKIIYLNDIEGREYDIEINEKYHSIVRVYFRGNRTYLLLKQKLTAKEKVSVNDPFFDSFTLLPYKETTLTDYESPNKTFKIKLFENVKEDIDTLDFNDTNVINSYDYTSVNPNSGNIYQYGYNTIGKYFRIASYKALLNEYKTALLERNDSIIDEQIVVKNGDSILQFTTKNKVYINTRQQTINRIWYNNYRVHLIKAILTDDEANSTIMQQVFNSVDIQPMASNIDIFASKAQHIIKDLKSQDSTVYNRALKTFNYYEFNKGDLSVLNEALNHSFSEENNDDIKTNIVNEFALINDESSLETLETLYNQPTTSDQLKTAILVAIPNIESETSLALYTKLLFSNPPIAEDSYDYNLLQPFNDSLSYALENYDKLVSLMPSIQYRKDLIYLFTDLYNSELDSGSIIRLNYNNVLKYLSLDSEAFFNQSPANSEEEEEEEDYTYYNLMVAYLHSMNIVKHDNDLSNKVTAKFLNREDDKWLRLLAITARIFNNYPISDSILNQYLEDKYYRFEIIEAFHKLNKLQAIDKKYLKEKEFAKLSLYNYVGEDGSYPDAITILKKIEANDATFFAAKFDYIEGEPNDTISYIAIVGPINKVTQNTAFKMFDSYTYWDEYDDDWEAKIDVLIADFLEL